MRGMLRGVWIVGVVSLWMHTHSSTIPAANKPSEGQPKASAYLLRYHFEKNEVLNYQVDHETSMTTTAPPNYLEKVTNSVQSQKNHRVVGVDSKGNATLELMIKHAKMSAQFGDSNPLKFDSDHPKDCPKVYEHMRPIIGRPLARVQVSPRGELLQTRPQLPFSVLAKAKLVKADGSFSEGASQNFLIEFPEDAIKVGEGWTNTFEVKVVVGKTLTQNVTMQRSYELVKVDGNIATIKLRTGLITPTRDGMILGQLIQMSPNGTIEFDLEKGRILSRTLTIDKTEAGIINGHGSVHAESKRVERWIDPKADDNKQASK
ncbi:MAG: hypothetical protein KDA84_18900 [Planctomycetaceae bacterium]|nr:hypothetical protein [Planctomycetaceae bacterium]